MSYSYPEKVLITGGREIGGVGSFAHGLQEGFAARSIQAEVVTASSVLSRLPELRNPKILKILSTTAVFAAPVCRRAICVAHGIPRGDYQGWRKLMGIIGSFKLANRSSGTQLVAVSHYTAANLRAIFNVRCDMVIHNPVKQLYLEPLNGASQERRYITYVGRLIAAKNLHRILPAIKDLLDGTPELRACIIGEGNQRAELESMVAGDSRFEFKGAPDDHSVREYLRQTKVFVSGNEVEGFGISYLEALTQGCIVAMPGSGGGLEIAPEKVGCEVQLFPLSWDRAGVLATLRRALNMRSTPINASSFSTTAVVSNYLTVDSRFLANGSFIPR